jgi:MFS family permease
LLGVGVAGILAVPSARIWGKRHLFLLGTLLIIISSAWGGASRSYVSLLWARIFQGVGTAPFEALVNAAVGDLYFVHVSDIYRICVDETYLPSNRNVASAWL